VTSENIHQLLEEYPQFARGYEQRDGIIKLGALIRKLRKEYLGITQQEAAKLIGMQQSELSRIETGAGQLGPSMPTLNRIIGAFSNHYSQHHHQGSMELTLGVRVTDGDTVTQVKLLDSDC
jgi:predicted transcriptional regulator